MRSLRLRKLVAAFVIGAFAASGVVSADAKRIHDPKVSTKSEVNESVNKGSSENVNELKAEGVEKNARIGSVLRPEIPPHAVLNPDEEISVIINPVELDPESGLQPYEGEIYVRQTVSPYDTSIIGTPMASQEQCVRYLLRNNPAPNLPVSAEEIVAYYYEEGAREGIRPDVAFAQALKETGFFRYGGDVVPEQNNYCGLGTTGGGVKGEYFASPQLGVRAHIQHLLAYSSTRRPTTPIIDPRYHIVRKAYGARTLGDWQDLNGRWAVPGNFYGQEILSMFKAILVQ